MQSASHSVHLEFHEGTLRLRGATAKLVARLFPQGPFLFDHRDDCYRADAQHYATVSRQLELFCQQQAAEAPPAVLIDEVLATFDITFPRGGQVELRSDQQEACKAFEDGGGRGLIVMPTGTGKTVVAIELIRRAETSTLIVVPTRDLMYQWHNRLLAATGVDAGLIGDGVHRVSPVSVTTYESATIHMHRLGNRFGMLIFDEVHHLTGQWRCDAAKMSAAPCRLGLTATLPADKERMATLQTLVGPVLYQQAISAATGRTLANYQVRRVAVEMTTGELRRYRELGEIISRYVAEQRRLDPRFQWPDVYKQVAATDTAPEQAKEASRALRASRIKKRLEERNAAKLEILSELFRSHAGESILVFVGSNVMAREIALQFMVPCLLSHCGKRERADLLEGFADGRYPVLVANQVLDEGIDLPAVKVAVVLGGMGSSRQAVQRLGRLLRRNARDANRRAVLYEVVTSASGEVERSRKRRRHEAFRTQKGPASGPAAGPASGPAADKPTLGEGGPDVA